MKNLGIDMEHSMTATYTGVYIDYHAEWEIDVRGIKSTRGCRFWERNMPDSYPIRELDAMIADSGRGNSYFLPPEGKGQLTGDQTGGTDGRFNAKSTDGKPSETLQQICTTICEEGLL